MSLNLIAKHALSYNDETVLISSSKITLKELQIVPLDEYIPEQYIYLEAERTPYNAVETLIVEYSARYGIDPVLPLAIAKAESNFKNVPNHKYDGESGIYTAYGIFQFLKSTWLNNCSDNPADRMDVEKNIDCGVRMISEKKEGHWNESRKFWKEKPPVTTK